MAIPFQLELGGWAGGLSALTFTSAVLLAAFAFRAAVYGLTHGAQSKT